MSHGQWRLIYPGVDYTFGAPPSQVFNRKVPVFNPAEVLVGDADRPRSDGRSFGVDTLSGQSISFDLGVRAPTDAEVREEMGRLRNIWRADAVRLTPGAVAELRMEYAGKVRAVFGRPRRFSPDYTDVTVNRFGTTLADFVCVDDLFYGITEESISFGIVPKSGGGLIAPLASPLSTTLSSDRSQGMTVDTELPAWPVVEISGPITNPFVILGEGVRFDIRTTLAYGETLVIDTRPWRRSALRNGANIAGSVRGTRLAQAALPAGDYEVALGGIDPTGTASVRISYLPTYPSL